LLDDEGDFGSGHLFEVLCGKRPRLPMS
jgi:hypothetical protein